MEEARKQPEIGENQESPQDVPAFWAEVLTEKGYNVSSEEIASYIREAEEERRKKTAGKIEELPDDALSEVAGGGDHWDCEFTYKDGENCWAEDACDAVLIDYDSYQCKRLS